MRFMTVIATAVVFAAAAVAEDFEYKLYFGLSKPAGGIISLAEWQAYEAEFSRSFAGFNVATTTGFYLTEKEESRIITLYMDDCREPILQAVVRSYVTRFGQDSVLVAKSPVTRWALLGNEQMTVMDDVCSAD